MRLNVDNYRHILSEKGIEDKEVIKFAGLSEKTYLWILDNGFVECETLERIADAIGSQVGEIVRPDYDGYAENVIEWGKDREQATLSLSQRRTISKVKRLATQYPDQCQIMAENKDGSIYAHIPVSWMRINPPRKLSDEQRQQISERLNRK